MLNRQVILYISNSYQKVLLSIDTGFFTASRLFYEDVIFLTEIEQPYRKNCKKEAVVSRFINR